MEITFELKNSRHVAEFDVHSDFNVHLEFPEGALTIIRQKTSGEEYAFVSTFRSTVVDSDFDGIVWPKRVQITCDVLPTLAIVTES